MKYFMRHRTSLREYFLRRPLWIALDFDGTLSPIVSTPNKAVVSKKVQNLLRVLSRQSDINLCVISGRTLTDIMQRVGVAGIIYAGVHGFEWNINGTTHALSVISHPLRPAYNTLRSLTKKYPGSFVEDKKYSLAVHFRLLPSSVMETFWQDVGKTIAEYKDDPNITVKHGKRVVEFFLNHDWNKGKFLRHLLGKIHINIENVALLYIGDDRTDEDVFELFPGAVTIKVGKVASAARYYVHNESEVEAVLSWLTSLKQ